MYTQPASALSPALIIYLIDASDSMNAHLGGATKIEHINAALRTTLKDMVRRSMRDGVLQRRYKLAMITYNTQVTDILGGIRDLPDVLQAGFPTIQATGASDAAGGFEAVERLLSAHLASFTHCPAPLVCHLTDGQYTTTDPSATARRIKSMSVTDGPVLIENIYFADQMLRQPVDDWSAWPGVQRAHDLTDDYARFLWQLSSPLPESYRENINNYGYHLAKGAAMFFPGVSTDLMKLAFVVSAATQLK